jgi:hypothetical protein
VGVTVRANFAPLADFPLSTKDLMREIGLLARERILRRTAAGLDQHDAAFAPYSPGYALQKAKELGSARVNLQVSGAMLNAIVVTKVTEKSVTLEFSA